MGSKKFKLSLEAARGWIRQAGLRATPGRIAVLQILAAEPRPQTHAELVDRMAQQGSDASTIFRALNDMADAGLLRRLELGDHMWRYEVGQAAATGQSDAHPHFLCIDCGDITCLEPDDVGSLNPNKRGLKKVGQVTEVLLKGHCSDCRDSS